MLVVLAVAGVVLLLFWGRKDRPNDPIYTFDSVSLQPIDPALFHYEQVEEINTGLKHPAGIALGAADRLYVAGEDLVRRGTAGWDMVRLPQPAQCVAVDSGDRVYVGLKDRVLVVEPAVAPSEWPGKTHLWPTAEGTPDFRSIAVAPDGRHIFVADRGNGWVIRYDGEGKLLGQIGREDEAGTLKPFNTKLTRCFDVAIGCDGLLRVVDPVKHEVHQYSLDGERQWLLQLPALGCCNPTDIAMRTDGSFVAAEKGAKAPRVKVYDPAGKLAAIVAGAGAFMQDDALLDLAVDSQGRVCVLDPFRLSVRVFRDQRTSSSAVPRQASRPAGEPAAAKTK